MSSRVSKKFPVFFTRLAVVFISAFLLNLLWEHLHSVLYVHYRGGEITNSVLTHAAFFDAKFSLLLAAFFILVPYLRKRLWLAVLFAFIYAVGLEMYALETGRWAYTDAMPIIPILGVGLTPAIQLGLLFFISIKLASSGKIKE